MSSSLERGIVLMGQGRFDLAAKELRSALVEDPEFAVAHAALARCLLAQSQLEDALREAEEAVRLDPSRANNHHVLGLVLLQKGRVREAEEAARQAIAIDPHEAEFHGLLAGVHLARKRWEDVLEVTSEALALDPNHLYCANLRAVALVHLGRKDEAKATLGTALSEDPDDALTHANQGWTYLHEGDAVRAEEHFRESLRLEPDGEWARQGLIEAIKARNVVYRVIMGGFLWLQRQSRWSQTALLIAVIFGPKLLGGIVKDHPALGPYLTPISLLLVGVLITTWVAKPLSNLALLFHPLGRLALTRRERFQAVVVGGLFLSALASLLVVVFTDSIVWQIRAMYFGLLIFPAQAAFGRESEQGWKLMAFIAVSIALLGLPMFLLTITGVRGAPVGMGTALELWQVFSLAAILSSWVPALLGARSLAR
jgi:tetratricopeptide (TPR) repeat protein